MSDESPRHGKLSCRLCFPVGQAIVTGGEWQARNDPGHWGGSNPKILVLGFSKGKTQSDVYAGGAFDEVVFNGMRERAFGLF